MPLYSNIHSDRINTIKNYVTFKSNQPFCIRYKLDAVCTFVPVLRTFKGTENVSCNGNALNSFSDGEGEGVYKVRISTGFSATFTRLPRCFPQFLRMNFGANILKEATNTSFQICHTPNILGGISRVPFKVQSQYTTGKTERNTKNRIQDSPIFRSSYQPVDTNRMGYVCVNKYAVMLDQILLK